MCYRKGEASEWRSDPTLQSIKISWTFFSNLVLFSGSGFHHGLHVHRWRSLKHVAVQNRMHAGLRPRPRLRSHPQNPTCSKAKTLTQNHRHSPPSSSNLNDYLLAIKTLPTVKLHARRLSNRTRVYISLNKFEVNTGNRLLRAQERF